MKIADVKQKKLLPDAYQELEYIQSDGNQWIATGISFSQLGTKFGFDIEFKVNNTITGNRYMFGSETSTGRCFNPRVEGTSTALTVVTGGSSTNLWVNKATLGIGKHNIEFRINNKTLSYTIDDSTTKTSTTSATVSSTGEIYLFSLGSESNNFNEQIYSFKILDENNNILRNFIPCYQISTGNAGMYDLISNAFFGNSGTGGFSRGPEHNTMINTFSYNRIADYIMGSRLPKGYQEVEYLQSSGVQWIDTGVIGNQNTSWELEVNLLNTTIVYPALFGARQANSSNYTGLATANNLLVRFMYGSTLYESSSYKWSSLTGEFHKFKLDTITKSTYIDDAHVSSLSSPSFSTLFTMYLFQQQIAGAPSSYPATMQLKSCKIWDEEELVRDFVPCYRQSDNKPGLYDLVNSVFYENEGTGVDFTVGSNVGTNVVKLLNPADAIISSKLPVEYQQVEYLESTGEQWIDTGLKANQSTKIIADFQFTEVGNNKWLFGGRSSGPLNGYSFHCYGTSQFSSYYGKSFNLSQTLIYGNNTQVESDINRHLLIKESFSDVATTKYAGKLDGQDIYLSAFQGEYENFETAGSIVLFNGKVGSGLQTYYCKLKLYSFKFYQDGTTLNRDLVPCYRKADHKPGMYDLVNNVFYTNRGTEDDFTVGQDVQTIIIL